MSFPTEYLGTFNHFCTDGAWRKIHVWVAFDPVTVEVDSIYTGISSDLSCAHGPMTKQQCASRLALAAWQFALRSSETDMVIEPDTTTGTEQRYDHTKH